MKSTTHAAKLCVEIALIACFKRTAPSHHFVESLRPCLESSSTAPCSVLRISAVGGIWHMKWRNGGGVRLNPRDRFPAKA